ncbi:hypothetical protein BDN71DRAFT_1173661 [Pleurotus eryngii]|uniref:Uncharacterized protein n=1 Tax=Pleurotus eryngii TaxID=5323 RepID=A0A9P5ZSA6_PLEER|nr:hypothetical protein BDN71DRAFT_1173661 [Pleurotus eryngii]
MGCGGRAKGRGKLPTVQSTLLPLIILLSTFLEVLSGKLQRSDLRIAQEGHYRRAIPFSDLPVDLTPAPAWTRRIQFALTIRHSMAGIQPAVGFQYSTMTFSQAYSSPHNAWCKTILDVIVPVPTERMCTASPSISQLMSRSDRRRSISTSDV